MNTFLRGLVCAGLLVAGAARAGEVVTGAWSQVKGFLRARLVLEYPIKDGVNQLAVHLELENVCPPEGTIWATFPLCLTNDLQIVITDRKGEVMEPRPVFCSTFCSPQTIHVELPQNSTVSYSLSQNGGGTTDDKMLVYLTCSRPGWGIPLSASDGCTISATLTHDADINAIPREWRGQLVLPPVKLPSGGPADESPKPRAMRAKDLSAIAPLTDLEKQYYKTQRMNRTGKELIDLSR